MDERYKNVDVCDSLYLYSHILPKIERVQFAPCTTENIFIVRASTLLGKSKMITIRAPLLCEKVSQGLELYYLLCVLAPI